MTDRMGAWPDWPLDPPVKTVGLTRLWFRCFSCPVKTSETFWVASAYVDFTATNNLSVTIHEESMNYSYSIVSNYKPQNVS